jgi:hypothetical protein
MEGIEAKGSLDDIVGTAKEEWEAMFCAGAAGALSPSVLQFFCFLF